VWRMIRRGPGIVMRHLPGSAAGADRGRSRGVAGPVAVAVSGR
jgi:hypothetical protein